MAEPARRVPADVRPDPLDAIAFAIRRAVARRAEVEERRRSIKVVSGGKDQAA